MTAIRRTLLLALIVAQSALAQELVYESEPNDTPEGFNPVAGEVDIAGTLTGVDQDGFLWTVSDADAEKRWTIRLDGIPGALTIIQVFRLAYAENGVDVAGKEKLFGMGSRDGSQPVFERDLLFEPGEYVIGFAYAGGGSSSFRPPTASIDFGDADERDADAATGEPGGYRAKIRATSGLSVQSHNNPPSEQSAAQALRPGRLFSSFVASENSWYRLELDEEQGSALWEIRGQLPVGQKAEVFLRNAEGEAVSDTEVDGFGRFKFTDLGLGEGTHFVEVQGKQPNMIRLVEAAVIGQRVEGAEAEENGSWDLANVVDWAVPVTGRLGVKNDADFFRFTLDEAGADALLELSLETGPEQAIQVCLLDAEGKRVQCRKSTGAVNLPKLALSPGEWGVVVSRGPEGAEYSLNLEAQGSIVAGTEVEPNDQVEHAVSVPSKNRIKGRFDTHEDVDYYRFLVTDEAQLWRFQAIGEELQRITYLDGAGRHGQEFRETTRRLRLENLFLMPGQHFIAIYGKPGTDYTLLARPLGPPDPDGEFEPNDDPGRAQRIDIGQRRNGLVVNPDDLDFYRFTLYDWERLRITMAPPADGSIQVHHYWEYPAYFARPTSGVGEPLVFEGLYPPGEHLLSLRASQPSDAEYHVSLERLDRFGCPVDCEPNPDAAFASPLPPSMVVEGSTTAWTGTDTRDFYALPVLDTEQELVIRADEQYKLVVTEAHSQDNLVAWDEELGAFRGTIPAGVMTYLDISGANDHYRLVFEFADGPVPLTDATPPLVEAVLELDAEQVKAYREYGQRVSGRLRLVHNGSEAVTLTLDAATTDRRWQVDLGRDEVDLAPGDTADVPLVVRVPDDAWANRDVRVSVRAGNRAGAVSAYADIGVDPTVEPVEPTRHYDLPQSLLGGFNVAGRRFGGTWLGDNSGAVVGRRQQAINDIAVPGNGAMLRGGHKGETAELVFELAGDELLPIKGFVVNSLAGQRKRTYLRIADIAVSEDGTNWRPAVFAPLEPVNGEQAFVLEQPVSARFIRLIPEHNWQGVARRGERLGEIKAIAPPGFDMSAGRGFNLASRELGGRVVWHRPFIDAYWGNAILREEGADPNIRMKIGETLSWVIGFHHDRAARVDRLEWVHKPPEHLSRRFERVQVSASMDSPLGPWTPVGEWVLSAEGAMDVFQPETPFWARYVKFTTNPVDEWVSHALPTPLRAWEVPTSDDYRSVLTEWGELSRQAFWESTRPVAPEPLFVQAANDAKERAARIEPGEEASGAVLLAEHEHWYRLDVPADHNTVSVTLTGRPTVRTVVQGETMNGEPVRFRRNQHESSPWQHQFEATVEPGASLYLNIEEPPRNVVFAWDTSPSVAPFVPIIYQALLEFSSQARPGLDAVNFMPFGHGLLLKEWFSEPYVLQTVINEYPRRESSSLAETTLARASLELAPRPGTKAVLLITDAYTPRYRGGLWDALEATRPRVFGLGVNIVGTGSDSSLDSVNHAYDLMQGWSAVNGGKFTTLLTSGELEVAFDRAQTLLSEPAPYGLTVETAFREAPGPGTLVIEPGADVGTAPGSGAVELILDASGSMLQRLGGKRRIAVAKEVLTEAVGDWIPEGTPVALRVFGHREPNACRTDLEVALAPLNRAAVAERIAGVNAMNLAKTPIADSLAAAAGDLSGAKGAVSILLLTDGEETCEGDPAEAIAGLQEKGIDVTLNIVGLAINNDATEAQFEEWAALGGGRYFAATDQAGLANAVNEALKAPFVVYDDSGARVAEGLVGGAPVELEAGVYRVVVKGATQRSLDNVEVIGEKRTRLELDP